MAALTYALGRHDCPWQIVALARSSLVLFIGLGMARVGGVPLVLWRPRALWARSLAGSVSLVCSFYALTHLRTSDALTLASTFTVWIALLTWPLEGRPPGLTVWLALASGIAGVVLIEDPHFDETGRAVIVALTGALFSAIAMLGLHRIQGVAPLAVVVHFGLLASVTSVAAITLSFGVPSVEMLNGTTLAMLAGVGLSATVGQVFLTKAFAAGPPTKVAVVSLSQIAFALGFDVGIWGHALTWPKVVGIALVAAPAAWLMTGSAPEAPETAGEPLHAGD
jgi:drug/metabolite transporter (DMT)-like permease